MSLGLSLGVKYKWYECVNSSRSRESDFVWPVMSAHPTLLHQGRITGYSRRINEKEGRKTPTNMPTNLKLL